MWWKKGDYCGIPLSIEIDIGLYIIDKDFCKENVILSSNNKTNSLIESKELYKMLMKAKSDDLFIPFPNSNKRYNFSITSAFV